MSSNLISINKPRDIRGLTMDKKSDQDRKNAPLHKNGTKPAGKDSEKNKRHESFARAAGEDDDGYDLFVPFKESLENEQ